MAWKGQGATELIVLLALIAVVGLVIYSSSQGRLSESSKTLVISQARATVNDLASAASEVYSEGPGARRKVYVTIPEGVNSSRVFINNTMINIGINLDPVTSTDINTQTTMKLVQGADFPTTPGSYWVYVTAEQGYVLIGTSNLYINPQSLSFLMPPSNLTSSTIAFTDVGTVPLSVTLVPQWSYNSTVNITLNTTSFTLSPSSTVYLLVTAQTFVNTPLQAYNGKIVVSTNTSETDGIGLSVNVAGTQISTGVSSIVIDTFKTGSYSGATTNFTLPTMVNINGSGWTNATVTLTVEDIYGNAVGSSISVTADSSGAFTYPWNPAGVNAGVYTVAANQSSTTKSASFNITACP
jgi:hypothetical protein